MAKKGILTKSDYLPYEEFIKLVDSLEAEKLYWWAAYCTISFAFALRVSDVRTIRWCQVLGHKNIVVQEKKTGKTRSIPIGKNTEERIHRLFKKMESPNYNGVIACNKQGNSISSQYINRNLKAFIDKYNLSIEHFSTHTFRKTFGRYVYEKMGRSQESLILLNRILQHSNISTTMVYLGIRDDEISNIFENL